MSDRFLVLRFAHFGSLALLTMAFSGLQPATLAGAEPPIPTINATRIDSGASPTLPRILTIMGHDFGSAKPAVSLSGQPLVLTSYTDSLVVAQVSLAVPAGSYTVSLTDARNQTANFITTIGAVGPTRACGAARTSRS